jgi:hypothetical protein
LSAAVLGSNLGVEAVEVLDLADGVALAMFRPIEAIVLSKLS